MKIVQIFFLFTVSLAASTDHNGNCISCVLNGYFSCLSDYSCSDTSSCTGPTKNLFDCNQGLINFVTLEVHEQNVGEGFVGYDLYAAPNSYAYAVITNMRSNAVARVGITDIGPNIRALYSWGTQSSSENLQTIDDLTKQYDWTSSDSFVFYIFNDASSGANQKAIIWYSNAIQLSIGIATLTLLSLVY